MTFGSLPASTLEARSIAAIWKRHEPLAADGLLLDAAASETAVKRLAAGRRVLHLATHGFFDAGVCRTSAGLATPAGLAADGQDVGAALLGSGVALAGANRRAAAADSEDDGMLLGAEIANLDLSGVEWAVLSACDTGLGSIAAGEGVFGLRRAFRVAGAATVIMSLWPVDDEATRAWVERLYRARLEQKRSTADAVQDASHGVLAARRRAGLSTHPFYWAGFIAAGDWR